jgi:hypothetical protein
MRSQRHLKWTSSVVFGGLCLTLVGCDGQEYRAPELQTTTGTQQRMEPMTTTGCLRAGVAENTFVLLAAKTEGAGETATYQLAGADSSKLRDLIGQQVEVSGTLRAEEEVASRGAPVEADRARGTSGTPAVETKTEVDVRWLDASAVRPTGQRCEE